jgi:MFS family permease
MKNIYILTVCSLVLRLFVQGLLPIYPILIQNTGAKVSQVGYFMAIMYVASLLGTLCSGYIVPKKIQAKAFLVYTTIPIGFMLWLVGMQKNYFSLLTITSVLSFFAAANINGNAILTGHYSTKINLAKNFGWLGLSSILATLLGGLIIGWSIDNLGMQTAFLLFAFIFVFFNSSILFAEKVYVQPVSQSLSASFRFSKNFILFICSSVLIILLIHVFKMSLSLEMKKAGYTLTDISLYSAYGTLMVLFVPQLLGYLDKKVKAYTLLIYCYITTVMAFLLLLTGLYTITIILAIACISILAYASRIPVMSLLYGWFNADTFPKAQTYYAATAWVAAIIGYLSVGQILERFGFKSTLYFGVCTGVLALLVLKSIKNKY